MKFISILLSVLIYSVSLALITSNGLEVDNYSVNTEDISSSGQLTPIDLLPLIVPLLFLLNTPREITNKTAYSLEEREKLLNPSLSFARSQTTLQKKTKTKPIKKSANPKPKKTDWSQFSGTQDAATDFSINPLIVEREGDGKTRSATRGGEFEKKINLSSSSSTMSYESELKSRDVSGLGAFDDDEPILGYGDLHRRDQEWDTKGSKNEQEDKREREGKTRDGERVIGTEHDLKKSLSFIATDFSNPSSPPKTISLEISKISGQESTEAESKKRKEDSGPSDTDPTASNTTADPSVLLKSSAPISSDSTLTSDKASPSDTAPTKEPPSTDSSSNSNPPDIRIESLTASSSSATTPPTETDSS